MENKSQEKPVEDPVKNTEEDEEEEDFEESPKMPQKQVLVVRSPIKTKKSRFSIQEIPENLPVPNENEDALSGNSQVSLGGKENGKEKKFDDEESTPLLMKDNDPLEVSFSEQVGNRLLTFLNKVNEKIWTMGP